VDFILKAMRAALNNGLLRAKILGALRHLATAGGGAIVTLAIPFLLSHGFTAQDATTYGDAAGGLAVGFIMLVGGATLSWVDKNKVDVQLQTAAATSMIVPVPGVLKVPSADQVIADAKAGKF